MDPRTAVETYRHDNFENAPPIKLVRMLYQGALRFLDRALECDPADPRSLFAENVGRCDAIVLELRLALEKDRAPDVAENLEQLYLFCERELRTALERRDASPLKAVREILVKLLGAWSAVESFQSKPA